MFLEIRCQIRQFPRVSRVSTAVKMRGELALTADRGVFTFELECILGYLNMNMILCTRTTQFVIGHPCKPQPRNYLSLHS